MVYLAWRSNAFGTNLEVIFDNEEKAKKWLKIIASKYNATLYEAEGLVRKESGKISQIGIDDGISWWIEKRDVE